jgi:hypothetical protein
MCCVLQDVFCSMCSPSSVTFNFASNDAHDVIAASHALALAHLPPKDSSALLLTPSHSLPSLPRPPLFRARCELDAMSWRSTCEPFCAMRISACWIKFAFFARCLRAATKQRRSFRGSSGSSSEKSIARSRAERSSSATSSSSESY